MYHDLRALLRPFHSLLITALILQGIAGIASLLPWRFISGPAFIRTVIMAG